MVAQRNARSRLSRRSALALAGGAAAGTALGFSGRTTAQEGDAPGQQVYFGWVLGSADIVAVAIDISAEDDAGERTLLAYFCDRLGLPDGIAL